MHSETFVCACHKVPLGLRIFCSSSSLQRLLLVLGALCLGLIPLRPTNVQGLGISPQRMQRVFGSSSLGSDAVPIAQDTLRPILARTAWSLNIALRGTRPPANVAVPFQLGKREADPLIRGTIFVQFQSHSSIFVPRIALSPPSIHSRGKGLFWPDDVNDIRLGRGER